MYNYKSAEKRRIKMGLTVVAIFLVAAVYLSYQTYLKQISDQTATVSMVCLGAQAQAQGDLSTYIKPSDRTIAEPKSGEKEISFAQTGIKAALQAGLNEAKAANIIDNGVGIAAGGSLTNWKQEDLNKFFQELNNLGVTWVRWDMDWQEVQPDDSEKYDWEGADRVASTAKKYGIKSLGIITYAPEWAQDGTCPSGEQCPPESDDKFANFAGTVAERYAGNVDAWEIWNEPNEQTYWYPAPDAGDYTELLKAAYTKIKEANPDAVVVSAGLTDMGDKDGVSISPLNFINSMYENGAKDYFDIMALHPYTYPGYDYGWPQITAAWKAMEANGDGGKKIWITEYGAPTGGAGRAYQIGEKGFYYGKDFMSEEAQSQMAKSIFAFKSANPTHIGNVFWYSLCDNSTDKSDPENFFGILRYDGTKKLVYQTLKDIIAKL